MKPTPPPLSLRSATALAALLSIAPSMAAETPAKKDEAGTDKKKNDGGETLDEVVVTAAKESTYKPEKLASVQKYPVPLRDVPQTVNVVPKQVIEEQGATTLADVLRNVPGITMQSGENGNAAVNAGGGFTMRGFDTNNSIFVNGVRDVGYVSRDAFNLESVEVFQGPTGSDVGRGNGAGYVNLQTKTPHLGNEYGASIGVRSADTQRYTADVNQEITQLPGTAFRLNALFQDGGVAGRDWVERNVWSIAPSLAFGLGTDTRAFLSYQYTMEDNIPDYGLPSYLGRPLDGVDPEDFYGNTGDHEDLTQAIYNLRLEHDITDKITVRNQTVFIRNEADINGINPQYSAATNRIARVRQANGIKDFETFSNQTSLSAEFETGMLKHSLSSGIEYTKENQDVHTYRNAAVTIPALPIGSTATPNPHEHIPQPPMDTVAFQTAVTETIGAYVFDSVEIGKHFILTGGLRWDNYDVEYRARSAAGVVTGPLTGNDDIFSGKIGLVYKPVEEGSIYVSYSSTQTPPGTGAISEGAGVTGTTGSTTVSNNNFNSDPQESQNIELGAKWEFFQSKLILTGALFHTRNENVIYQDNPGFTPATFSTDGAQNIDGLSVGVAGQITENWNILVNATYLDSELDQKGARANDPNGVSRSIDGNQLVRTPEFSGSIWTTYKLPAGFTIGAGVRYQDHTWVNSTNTIDIPTYAVVDAMVQYDVNPNLNLRLNVYNLLDREYIATSGGGGGGGGGSATNGGHVLYGTPISFAFSTNFKF